MTLPAYPPEPLRPTQCRHPIRLIGETADPQTGEITGIIDVDTRCKRWVCEGCGRRLRWIHIKLVKLGIEYHRDHGRMGRLLTLTFATDTGAQVDRAEDVTSTTALVARLIQEIRRTHSPRLEYYAVKESTKRGRLHVHLVTTGPYLHKCRYNKGGCDGPGQCKERIQKWEQLPPEEKAKRKRPKPCIQNIAHRLGFGWVDVRKIRSTGEAAAYVAKYLGKQVGLRWPKHSRRSTYSRGRLYCKAHPDNNGARCCPEAKRRTFYAPTTIGWLSKVAGDIAYARGIGRGYFDPTPRPPVVSWRHYPEPRAPPAPDIRPPFERTEAEAVRLASLRIEAGARLAGIDPDDPMQGDALRAFLKTATLAPT